MDTLNLTTLQKATVTVIPRDVNENAVATNGAVLAGDNTNQVVCRVENLSDDGKTFDVVGLTPGTAAIIVSGTDQQGNVYSYQLGVNVIMDPSIPGPPTNFSFSVGSLVTK